MFLPIATIIVVTLAIVSFVMERIPLAMTAIAASLVLGIIGAIGLEDVYSSFSSSVTVFCAGMMVVGNTLFRTGFADMVARGVEKLGLYRSERLLVIVVTAAAAFLSAWLSNSAVVAMFIPLVALIAERSGGRVRMPIALMGTGLGAAVGGLSTLTGSTTQLITQGMLQQTEGAEPMGLFTLTRIGGPLVVITIVYMGTIGFNIGRRTLNFTPPDLLSAHSDEDGNQPSAPKWKLWFSIVVMFAIILAFAFGLWNIAIVSMLGAAVMILSGCISYKEALRGMDWNTLIILGSAQALGLGLTQSGGGKLIADGVVSILGDGVSPWMILAIFVLLVTLLTNLASNTALIVMFVPIVMSVATGVGADPTSWAIVVTIACSLATGSPIGTPCVTQTMVGGFRFMDYVKIGGPLTVVLAIVTALMAPVAYPF